MLTQEFTSFSGEYFQLDNARCEPKGLQPGGPPIVIGGGGEKRTLRIVAMYADHWNLPFASPEQFTAKYNILKAHCQTVGRDVNEIECSVQIALPADQAPSESASIAAALGEAGVNTVIFSLRNPYRVEILEPLAKALEDHHSLISSRKSTMRSISPRSSSKAWSRLRRGSLVKC